MSAQCVVISMCDQPEAKRTGEDCNGYSPEVGELVGREPSEMARVGNVLARLNQGHGLDTDLVQSALPEFTNKQARILCDNIETAIRQEVQRTLKERQEDDG